MIDGLRFHHVGVAVKDMESALAFYAGALGMALSGAVVDDDLLDVRVCLLRLPGVGEGFVELVAPLGEGSPIRSILKRNMTYYHLCYEVPDLEAAAAHLAARGSVQVVPPTPARLFDGRRVCFLMSATGLIELLEASAAERPPG